MNYVVATNQNITQFLKTHDLLICRLRPSRSKSKHLAILEMSIILSSFGGIFIFNGPLGDVGGVFPSLSNRAAIIF